MASGEPSLQDVMAELSAIKILVQSTLSSHASTLSSHASTLSSHASDLDYLKDVTMHIMKREIKLTATEVLKWPIGKKGKATGATFTFTTKNMKTLMKIGCVSFGRFGLMPSSVDEANYENIAAAMVAERNNIAHCSSIAELDERVRLCLSGIQRYPDFCTEFPDQCQILQQYDVYKKKIPALFT